MRLISECYNILLLLLEREILLTVRTVRTDRELQIISRLLSEGDIFLTDRELQIRSVQESSRS